MDRLRWDVFYYDINRRKISTFNIFEHGSFLKDVQKNLNKIQDKDEFAKELESDLMYYFWSKAEWEVIIAPWCGGDREKDAIKVDVFDQVMHNFEVFLNYVWEHRKD